jgi:cellulose synthase/poly-beta-1,6-N-acetylglucosamine synthase-like glycosyltransferase
MTSVSIIVPAWNEAKVLETTLRALLAVDYDKNKYEVLVIAGGEDNTYAVAQHLSSLMKLVHTYMVIQQPRDGKNTAIQLGIKRANNDIIVLLDADTIVSESWLKNIVRPIELGLCDLAIANSEPIKRNWVSDYYMINKITSSNNITWHPGHSIAFRNTLGAGQLEYFFDRRIKVGVDYFLEKRFLEQGRKIMFVKDAAVRTHVPSSLKYFIRGELRWIAAMINIDGIDYKALAYNLCVFTALILLVPVSEILFAVSLVFHTLYIGRKARSFLVARRGYKTRLRNGFGYVLLSYSFHILCLISYAKHLFGLSTGGCLYQGQR